MKDFNVTVTLPHDEIAAAMKAIEGRPMSRDECEAADRALRAMDGAYTTAYEQARVRRASDVGAAVTQYAAA